MRWWPFLGFRPASRLAHHLGRETFWRRSNGPMMAGPSSTRTERFASDGSEDTAAANYGCSTSETSSPPQSFAAVNFVRNLGNNPLVFERDADGCV
jgi:hypothetical protein